MLRSTKVRSKGQITLPKRIREAVNAKPGDTVHISVTGPDTLELRIFRPMTLAEMIEDLAAKPRTIRCDCARTGKLMRLKRLFEASTVTDGFLDTNVAIPRRRTR